MKTASPQPQEMTIHPEDCALDLGRVTAAHTPAPRTMRMKVPKSSDRRICPMDGVISARFLHIAARLVRGAARRSSRGRGPQIDPETRATAAASVDSDSAAAIWETRSA